MLKNQILVTSEMIEVINNYKIQLQKITKLRLNAVEQAKEKKYSMAISSQTEVAKMLNSVSLKKSKMDFRNMLTEIKEFILDQKREDNFPEIIKYDYGYDAEVSYSHILKIEQELQKI